MTLTRWEATCENSGHNRSEVPGVGNLCGRCGDVENHTSCCETPEPLDGQKRHGCVMRPAWWCDSCGAEMTLEQVRAAYGLPQEPRR